jgi:hypothetical protein
MPPFARLLFVVTGTFEVRGVICIEPLEMFSRNKEWSEKSSDERCNASPFFTKAFFEANQANP